MKISLYNSDIVCNAAAGEAILLACARAGVILSAPCGGRSRCGKCKVRILEGRVTGDTPDAEGWVLSCLAIPASDITIALGENEELGINEVLADREALPDNGGPMPASGKKRAGVAIDIGTTTVSARLIDLDTSQILETVSELNDQRVFGSDVMSRVGAAIDGKTQALFNLINRQTEKIISYFIKRWNLPEVEKLSVSGNTVMLHLFLNVNPSGMGALPFTPVFLEEKNLAGKDIALSAKTVSILPSIAAFIGSDITAGLAVIDIANIPGSSMLIDIGTNGEMALFKNGALYCCSTAAGPAFEGAEISCGAGGIKGAISGITPEDNESGSGFAITTIGNVPPVGICGSGLIDAVAFMLKKGIIDETGLMANRDKIFALAPGVSITGGDIRQFQLAKSAILSGIRMLCKNAGLRPAEIDNVFIAGGFGFFINRENAVRSGIFPMEFLEKISICGNLSLRGAEENLADGDFVSRCREIASRCSVIELASDPAFMDEFAGNMLF